MLSELLFCEKIAVSKANIIASITIMMILTTLGTSTFELIFLKDITIS
jgi:hypothetical protein